MLSLAKKRTKRDIAQWATSLEVNAAWFRRLTRMSSHLRQFVFERLRRCETAARAHPDPLPGCYAFLNWRAWGSHLDCRHRAGYSSFCPATVFLSLLSPPRALRELDLGSGLCTILWRRMAETSNCELARRRQAVAQWSQSGFPIAIRSAKRDTT
jgi:hypothetical protein